MGSAVKALRAADQHKLGGPVWILYDLVVPKAQDDPAFAFQEVSPSIVIRDCFSMLATIQLDRELGFATSEIDDVGFNHKLTGEARSIMAQSDPQKALGLSRVVAKFARVGC